MDKSAIDTPSREVDLRNIPVHLRTALRRALEFEARAPAPRSAEEAEQCEEQLRAIADEFFGALLTPVLQRAVRSAAVGDAASALVRHLPRRMRSDGLETVNVRTSRGTTVPVTTPYYREKHARRAKRRPGLDSTPPWWCWASTTGARRSWPPMQAARSPCSARWPKRRRSSAPTASPWISRPSARPPIATLRGPERPSRARRAVCWTA